MRLQQGVHPCSAQRAAALQVQAVGNTGTYTIAIILGRQAANTGCTTYLGSPACGTAGAGIPLLQTLTAGQTGLQQWKLTPITVACGTPLTTAPATTAPATTQPLANGVYNILQNGLGACPSLLSGVACPSAASGFAANDDGSGMQRWTLTAVAGTVVRTPCRACAACPRHGSLRSRLSSCWCTC